MTGDEYGDIPIECPNCGRRNDSHWSTDEEGARPSDGDMGICWGCHEPFIFVISVRKPNPEERARLRESDVYRDAMHAVLESYTPSESVTITRKRDLPGKGKS